MNRKQFIALLLLLVVTGVAGIVVYKRNSATWKPAPAAGSILGDFAANDVARMVIQTGTASLVLEKKNDKWVVPARDDYPADFDKIAAFVRALYELKPVEDVQVGPSQLGRFDLLPVGKGDGTGTLVDLQDKNSKRIAALLVGKKFLKKSPQAPDGEEYAAGRYVTPADLSPPKVSLVSDPLASADPSPAAWLDKTFLHIDRVQSVAFVSGTNRWALSRESDSATEWKLSDPKPGESLDPAKTPPITQILENPEFTDVMPASASAAGFDSTLTIATFDQVAYTLKFGKPDGENIPMALSVTGSPPKERAIVKDETPEEKKQHDAEFAAFAKRISDELAKAKTLESRIFLVPKAMIDMLTVPRAALMAAATPAPAPARPSNLAPSLMPFAVPPMKATQPPPVASPSPQTTPQKPKTPAS